MPEEQTVTETFPDNGFCVISHSGLHPAERVLIDRLSTLKESPRSMLVAGNRTGVIAMAIAHRFPACRITCHAFDLHHARTVLRNLRMNGVATAFLHDPFVICRESGSPMEQVCVACTSKIPEGDYEWAVFMSTATSMTGEVILDQLQEIHGCLQREGHLLFSYEGDGGGPIQKQIQELFGKMSVWVSQRELFCATADKRGVLTKHRSFSAEFTASVPGGKTLRLISLPGVFCHRRPDMGGLALAEVAARDFPSCQRILDLGCGCGLVGLLLAARHPDAKVVFVDSHARALAATWRNLESLGLVQHAQLELSDTGTALTEFDLAVGNPPYYSDFRITQLFVDTFHQALKREGSGLLVAKSSKGLVACIRNRFPETWISQRRGYAVVRFQKT